MSVTPTTPRPLFATVLAEGIHDEVLHWISRQEVRIGKDAYKAFVAGLPEQSSFFKLLEAASATRTLSEPDAFAICEDLKNTLDWPVNGALVDIFYRGIETTRNKSLRQRTIEWVLKTGVRFTPEREAEITFYDRDMNLNRGGRVYSVDRATATGVVVTKTGERTNVRAEDLVA